MLSMLSVNETLSQRSRIRRSVSAQTKIRVRELAILIGCGLAAAALSALADFSLRIPGHAVLRAVLPLALGMALVPRRGAGVAMGSTALVGAAGLSLAGVGGIGPGATTSLALLGPLLDLAVRRARPGWRLYAAFALAGLSANLGAFVVRGGAKVSGGGGAGLRPFQDWLSIAPLSYAACGMVAGLISAAILFRSTDSSSGRRNQEAAA